MGLVLAILSASAPAAQAPVATPPVHGAAATTLVVCAPGHPGTTKEAQPTMDAFAAAVTRAASGKPGEMAAVYHETLDAGRERLGQPDAGLALVTLPFYLTERKRLGLTPRLQVRLDPGGSESWSMVARKGRVRSPGDLNGWEILGAVGYSPAFVRGPVLGRWGTLPAGARIAYDAAPISSLRRAAEGEHAAVILDTTGVAALPTLQFAADLEVVTRSAQLPASLLCTVANHLPPAAADRLVDALGQMHRGPEGAAALKTIRLQRFEPLDRKALEAARQEFDRAALSGR
jgi:hypothetical protein